MSYKGLCLSYCLRLLQSAFGINIIFMGIDQQTMKRFFSIQILLILFGVAYGQNRTIEQTSHGQLPPARIVASFDGLGYGFEGPQGKAEFRNPSDNSLAVGPDHIVQTRDVHPFWHLLTVQLP